MSLPQLESFTVERNLRELERPLADTLIGLERERAAARLWQHDATLWTHDPAHRAVVESRLGWLGVIEWMNGQLPAIEALVRDAQSEGFRHALLLGMGGSSLAPEVFRRVFGVAPGHLDLGVLDNTSPEAVRAAEGSLDLAHTLFLVSTKSGTTTETLSFQRYFLSRLRQAGIDRPGRHFVAITDPGTPLESLAREEAFRQVFLNPADIGGRYSALSFFGLVPAALLGIDIARLLAQARAMAAACGPAVRPTDNPGVFLGAVLATAAQYGRDKLTLLPSPSLAPLGAWLEQLVAESSGKSGRGVVPVDGEPWDDAERYGPDRFFVGLSLAGESQELEQFLARLAAAGQPTLHMRLAGREALAAEFFRWEMAIAILGARMEVDPFDEPNVAESKGTTRELLAVLASEGRFPPLVELASVADGISVRADKRSERRLRGSLRGLGYDASDPASWLAAHLASVAEGDYLALCAYLLRTDARQARLDGLRARLGVAHATTLGFGPRFLHSTGQLHKGGANNGVFLQITAEDGPDLPIPGAAYTFGQLRDAQSLGDLMVLDRRERRALRVHLHGDPDTGLAALEGVLERALERIQS